MGHSKMPNLRKGLLTRINKGVVRYIEISSGEAVTAGRQKVNITKTHVDCPPHRKGPWRHSEDCSKAKYREAGMEWDERWIFWPLGLLLAPPSSTKPNKIHWDQFQRAKANTEKGHFCFCFGRHGENWQTKFILMHVSLVWCNCIMKDPKFLSIWGRPNCLQWLFPLPMGYLYYHI